VGRARGILPLASRARRLSSRVDINTPAVFRTLSALLLMHASPLVAQGLTLPIDGRWFIMQGGDTPNVNHHMQVESQWFAIDFAKVGGPSGRALTSGTPQRLDDFYGWGAAVRAPAAGEVVAVENALPDNPLGTHDTAHPLGNHVVLRDGERYYYLAHFQRGSVRVRTGDRVERGRELGRCGNSGNSDFPHVHLHVTRSPRFGERRGEMMSFSGLGLELSGKRITDEETADPRPLRGESRAAAALMPNVALLEPRGVPRQQRSSPAAPQPRFGVRRRHERRRRTA
jgi:hypothetical protein